MSKLNKEVENNLIEVGILEDDVREIITTGTVLLDKEVAKDFITVFIELGVAFKCEPAIDDLSRVTLL